MTSTAGHLMQYAQLILTHFQKEMTFWINAITLTYFQLRTAVPCIVVWQPILAAAGPGKEFAAHRPFPALCNPSPHLLAHQHALSCLKQVLSKWPLLGTIYHWKAFELPHGIDTNGPGELTEGSYRWGSDSRTKAVVPSLCQDRVKKPGLLAAGQPGPSIWLGCQATAFDLICVSGQRSHLPLAANISKRASLEIFHVFRWLKWEIHDQRFKNALRAHVLWKALPLSYLYV